MTKFVLKDALQEMEGPRNQFIRNLLGEDGETWWREFKKFLRKEKCWPDGPDSNSQRPDIGPKSETLLSILGGTLLSAMIGSLFCTLLWKQGGIKFFFIPMEVCFLIVSIIALFFVAAAVARFYGPTFRRRTWNWGEDFVAFGAIYLFSAPLMAGLLIAMIDQLAGLNLWDWNKPIIEFPVKSFLIWISNIYLIVLSIGYVWRVIRHVWG